MFYRTLAVCALLAAAAPVAAGKYNKKLSIGDAAPVWKNLAGTDGKSHSLSDLADKDFVVVAFMCNSCVASQAYEDRVKAFAKKYADKKVGLVAVNVSLDEDDTPEKMKEYAKTQGFTFPYVFDGTQDIGRAYGATVTPEFFVLDKARKIVYMGKLDNSQVVKNVTQRHLDDALDALLAGKTPATAETSVFGCTLEYKKKK